MKSLTNTLASIGLLAILSTGCASIGFSTNRTGMTEVATDGRHRSYVGTKEQVLDQANKHMLDSWTDGKDIYAEGNTYGMHFAEFSTSEDYLDGCATDGFTKATKDFYELRDVKGGQTQ